MSSTSSPSEAINRFFRASGSPGNSPQYPSPATKGSLAITPLPRPVRNPIRSSFKKLSRPKGVRQHDQQLATVALLPKLQHPVLRLMQRLVPIGKRCHCHRQLMRIGSHRLQVVLVRKKRIRCARQAAPTRRASPRSHTPARESYASSAFQTPKSAPQARHVAVRSSPTASSWLVHTTHPVRARLAHLMQHASSSRPTRARP